MSSASTPEHAAVSRFDDAVAALERRDPASARQIVLDAVQAGERDLRLWLLFGQASAQMGDMEGLERAADYVVAQEPRAVLGYIWKADCLMARADHRAAASFYAQGVRTAHALGNLTGAVAEQVARAEQELASLSARYVEFLDDFLTTRGFGGAARSPRFQKAFEILTGRREAALGKQRPTLFYCPDLPQREYYERSEFDWVPRIEAATEAIRDELAAVLADEGAFSPYVVGDPTRPTRDYHGMLDNPEWTSFYICKDGEIVEENAARCPRTAEAVASLPQPRVQGRSPTVMFSRLMPGAHIPPHNGMLNTRLICHLPLVVPDGCGFRVGDLRRGWHEGELLVFDDSIEHEAWNRGNADRVILLFDIARPELSDEENAMIAALFEAVDAYR